MDDTASTLHRIGNAFVDAGYSLWYAIDWIMSLLTDPILRFAASSGTPMDPFPIRILLVVVSGVLVAIFGRRLIYAFAVVVLGVAVWQSMAPG
jgi:hypothetical protein